VYNFNRIVGWIRSVCNSDGAVPVSLLPEPGRKIFRNLAPPNERTPYIIVTESANAGNITTFNGHRILSAFSVNIICVDKVGHDQDDQEIVDWLDSLFGRRIDSNGSFNQISSVAHSELNFRDPQKPEYQMLGLRLEIEVA